MAHPKHTPQIVKTYASALRRTRGDRLSAHDVQRAAFIKSVVGMDMTDEVRRDAQSLVREVRAASSASFLEQYRHAR